MMMLELRLRQGVCKAKIGWIRAKIAAFAMGSIIIVSIIDVLLILTGANPRPSIREDARYIWGKMYKAMHYGNQT